jgi:hypothetical protein
MLGPQGAIHNFLPQLLIAAYLGVIQKKTAMNGRPAMIPRSVRRQNREELCQFACERGCR